MNVSQGEASGSANYVPVCDGRPHTFTIRVQAFKGVFHVGDARALTFADVEHEDIGFSGFDESEVQIAT